MDKITIEIRCANCVSAKVIPDDWYECSRARKKWLIMGGTPICEYWKPRVSDVRIWIIRAEQALEKKG